MIWKSKTVKMVQNYFDVSFIESKKEEYLLKCHIQMHGETIFFKLGKTIGNERYIQEKLYLQ